ncbi:gluconeogenesis factor YvcK family protein [Corynebacterium lubricantis]|uniref:gluconeogenesis factor YvcK family protein n=1 Tax=Corynebacterium lubricantis TaxID=541095 RepID=UPI000369C129|nr:uridine diphosphate-N-acetylglucosamine-binding protein YvcK [Corynebacterium lubricantis]
MAKRNCSVVSLGGGHGLYQTLLAMQKFTDAKVNAVVTVADDGGSSGRIRKELDIIPPGDLRMALAALTPEDEEGNSSRDLLQHRFGGHGALAGHALGNLILAGLTERSSDMRQALDTLSTWLRVNGRVMPVCLEPLDLEADVGGLDDDPRVMRTVRGQVAVATTPGVVRRVRLQPTHPTVNPDVLEAIAEADVITLGPGSWFSSVIPHVLVPEIVQAINASKAMVVVILNLSPEAGETHGFTTERHIHVLSQHAPDLHVDVFLADNYISPTEGERTHLRRAANGLGATIAYYDVHVADAAGVSLNKHDPDKLASALEDLYTQR